MNSPGAEPDLRAFRIELETSDRLRVSFTGVPADNARLVREALTQMEALTHSGQLAGGPLLRVNGPASLPVAFVIAHAVAHRYQAVAIFDPKLERYVVAIAHGPAFQPGDLIE